MMSYLSNYWQHYMITKQPYELLIFDWNGTLSTGVASPTLPSQVPDLYPGVSEMIKQLNHHYELAIATATSQSQLYHELEAHQLKQYFSAFSCHDHGPKKPEAEVITRILDFLVIEPEQALMIGDSYYDIICAQNARVDVLGVAQTAHALKSFNPTDTLNHISELPQWLAARHE